MREENRKELNSTEMSGNKLNSVQTNDNDLNYEETNNGEPAYTRISCSIIRDLLPSYVDGICSEDSKKIIEQHLLTCPDCAALTAALRESETTARKWEAKQIAYLKKIKKRAGIKELVGLGILLITIGFSLRIFTEHYGTDSWIYFIALPLALFDTHFLLSDHTTKNRRTEPKIVLTLVSGLLLCIAPLTAFISVQWVRQDHYPFGLAAASLGPFLNMVYTILALCEFAIFAACIALTLKTSNSHGIAISISMTGVFLVLYILSIFGTLSSIELFAKTMVQSLYLLLEGGCITVITALLEKRKLRAN